MIRSFITLQRFTAQIFWSEIFLMHSHLYLQKVIHLKIFSGRQLNQHSIMFSNYHRQKLLSGPIDRGDIYTIKKHIAELDIKIKTSKDDRLKLLKKNYVIQSLSLLEVVKAKYGKLNKQHLEIESFLKKQLR